MVIPQEIATAVSEVMGEVKQLGKEETNKHGGYDFVSVDKFLKAVGPLCAKAGLIILMDEDSMEIIPPRQDGKSPWLLMRYRFTLAHRNGAVYQCPLRRSVMVQATGAQAFGSAQSYALKQFERSLFQIPTGDKDDADFSEPADLPDQRRQPAPPLRQPQRAAAPARPAAPAQAQRQALPQQRGPYVPRLASASPADQRKFAEEVKAIAKRLPTPDEVDGFEGYVTKDLGRLGELNKGLFEETWRAIVNRREDLKAAARREAADDDGDRNPLRAG
jgi:ERF superfamily